jgi:undecaprenyl-diphosphatase
VNNFAAAVVIGYFFRRTLPYGLGIAALIAFSRVYVGVHYPADVLGGAVIGAGVAGLVLWAWVSVHAWWARRRGLAESS